MFSVGDVRDGVPGSGTVRIGAGITGLTVAFYLKRKGVPVAVAAFDAAGESDKLPLP